MNATKRKFNALLQGLSNAQPAGTPAKPAGEKPGYPSSPATSLNASSDDILKRRRMGLPTSTPTTPSKNPPSHHGSPAGHQVTRLGFSKDSKGPPAKYCPGDRDELLRRLATFQEITDWTPKPDRVNEVEWAKMGWVCQGKERVRCVLCSRELLVKLNRKELDDGKEVTVLVASEIEEALVDKYVELMTTAHQEDCLWRRKGCDDSLLRLSLANAKQAMEALRQRYDELCTRKSFLPYEFNLRLPNGLDVDSVLQKLPPDFFTKSAPGKDSSSSAEPINRVALALALLGWQGLTNARIGAVPNSASCHTCLRRLGLWMFKSKEVDDSGQVLVPAPMDYLDPIREHRFFCPWKNPEAQARAGLPDQQDPLPGWKVLMRTIDNEAHLRGVYEGKSPARSRLSRSHFSNRKSLGVPSSPQVNQNPAGSTATAGEVEASGPGEEFGEDEEDEKDREAKDKERWARLRRVKSLFDSKGSRKPRRPLSQSTNNISTTSLVGPSEPTT
ncbi:C3HC zinc finger-like-domain-containing protein [Stachybotrys elegans]|uniref:C3HC zinc finger-like-domain-containing protein n=1 Tax=Stachybotrys elegans TaxID=80388 RepID=A0A8K0WQ06_9HYPO|nr:C3HC zinc finger-like-domain-containing protein [Stachybotrys elegans]